MQDQLPKEIQILILKKCDDKSSRMARVACREWFKIIDYRNFSFYLTTKSSWPLIVERMSTYNKPITLQLRKNVIKNLSDINKDLLRLTNITALTFDDLDRTSDNEIDEWFKLTSLPNLKSVHVKNSEYNMPIEPLLYLPHLTRFCHQWNRNEADFTEKIALQSIRRLTNLEHCELSSAYGVPENGPFESYHTKLTSLSVFVTGSRISPKWFEHLGNLKYFNYGGSSTTDLSLKSLTALESLCLFGAQIHEVNSTNLTQLELSEVNMKFLEKELDKLGTVKELILDLQDDGVSFMDEDLSYHWLTALTALESLNIDPIENDGIAFMSTNLTGLQMNLCNDMPADLSHLSKLTLLKDLYFSNQNDFDEKEIDLSAISGLLNLQCLRIDFKNGSHPVPFNVSTLSNLDWLALAGAPAEVCNLPKLEHLHLTFASDCNYTGFDGLPCLTHLEIMCNWEKVDLKLDYIFFSKLTKLKTLSLTVRNEISNCKTFAALTALESLTLYKIESEEDYVHLAHLKNLTKLGVWHGITSEKILQLPLSLQEIGMTFPEDSDASIVERIRKHFPNLHTCFIDFE